MSTNLNTANEFAPLISPSASSPLDPVYFTGRRPSTTRKASTSSRRAKPRTYSSSTYDEGLPIPRDEDDSPPARRRRPLNVIVASSPPTPPPETMGGPAGYGAIESQEVPAKLKTETPLPLFQMAIICFVRVTEPISYLVCFPYINRMGVLDENGLNAADMQAVGCGRGG